MALTQTQLDNLVTLLKSEDFEDIQNGKNLIETLVDSGMIGEEDFTRLIKTVTGGSVLNETFKFHRMSAVEEVKLGIWAMDIFAKLQSTIRFITVETIHLNDLDDQMLTELKEPLTRLNSIHSLELHWSEITELPEWIGELTTLVVLEATGCFQLTTLPDSIGFLTNLKFLTFFECDLHEIPETIGNLTNLKDLDVRSNDNVELPSTIYNLHNLESISLENTGCFIEEEEFSKRLPNCSISQGEVNYSG